MMAKLFAPNLGQFLSKLYVCKTVVEFENLDNGLM